MGGPGIVMSRATLKLIYPHIRTCLSNLYTDHEDVEIGRCVKKYAGVSCLWNYEVSPTRFSGAPRDCSKIIYLYIPTPL